MSPKLTVQELFNSHNAIATADLPCNLEALATNLSLISRITGEELIQNHTLYRFYAAFLPQERSQQILEAMRSGDGGGIHDQVGIRASLVSVPRYFRFCPKCAQDDQQTYGELYWHRNHQVPGVLVCPHHAEVLQDSLVPIQGQNRHEYSSATLDHCPVKPLEKSFSQKALTILHLLAQDVYFLLENDLPPRDVNGFRQQYIALLIEHGLATATGRVYQRELLSQFLCFYSQDILETLDSTVYVKEDHNWLTGIVRKHRKAFHPIRHLLLIRFLGASPEEFFRHERGYQPFGQGPWLCLNAAAKHYLKPVTTHLAIRLCCDTKKLVGTFSCSCGFVYCRSGPDTTEADARRVGKVKAVGSVWQQKLKHLVEVEHLGLRATARQLEVDPRTINRYVQLLRLKPKWRTHNETQGSNPTELPCPQSTDSDDRRTEHRNTWSALQTQYPQASKIALRRFAPATYSWLYRHDREWLDTNSPAAQTFIYPNHRVNWQERDEQILSQVKGAVQRLLTVDKPVRITISRVAKVIGQLALLGQHLDQMPLTKAYLGAETESIEDYQIRRVRWAAQLLDHRGESVDRWKVIRLAGLSPGYSRNVQAVLDYEVEGRKCSRCQVYVDS